MSSKPLLKKIVSLADDKKAENIVALDVSKITSLSEYFVVCSASNLIQVKAIADNIKENISENPWKTEGYEDGTWIILDYVDIVYAHRCDELTPMLETVRGFTDIIRSGKALYRGTSMWTAQKITEAYWIARMHKLIPPVVEQPIYNMFTRHVIEKEFVPLYEEPYRIGIVNYNYL